MWTNPFVRAAATGRKEEKKVVVQKDSFRGSRLLIHCGRKEISVWITIEFC